MFTIQSVLNKCRNIKSSQQGQQVQLLGIALCFLVVVQEEKDENTVLGDGSSVGTLHCRAGF